MTESRKKPLRLDWQGGLATSESPDAVKVALRGATQKAAASSSAPVLGKALRTAKMRREVKGRAGHPVLVLWGFEPAGLPASVLEAICSKLKGQLGCGGTLEEGTLVLQTENAERLSSVLKALGIACTPCVSGKKK